MGIEHGSSRTLAVNYDPWTRVSKCGTAGNLQYSGNSRSVLAIFRTSTEVVSVLGPVLKYLVLRYWTQYHICLDQINISLDFMAQ